MFSSQGPIIKYLDQSLFSHDGLQKVKSIIGKIEMCRSAVREKTNLADLLFDNKNRKALENTFGTEYDVGMQMLLRMVLAEYRNITFTTNRAIEEENKILFLYRSVGGWKNFDTVISLYNPEATSSLRLINPAKKDHWIAAAPISTGTVVTIYVKSVVKKGVQSQEALALDRYRSILESVQYLAGDWDSATNSRTAAVEAPVEEVKPKKKIERRSQEIDYNARYRGGMLTSGDPVKTLRFVISKMDTFVHAGNAHLIVSHLRNYKGTTKMFVLRADKEPVLLDADSIWTKEIRNGESVLYEFYGPQAPAESFLTELINRTNKYTQIDKLGE